VGVWVGRDWKIVWCDHLCRKTIIIIVDLVAEGCVREFGFVVKRVNLVFQ